jgi:hypothetical protein
VVTIDNTRIYIGRHFLIARAAFTFERPLQFTFFAVEALPLLLTVRIRALLPLIHPLHRHRDHPHHH